MKEALFDVWLYETLTIVASLVLAFIATYKFYFKKKLEAYGEIAAKHFKKEVLAEIEKSISDAKNRSEFEYHKRKEDAEKLEKLNLVLIEAFDYSLDVTNKTTANSEALVILYLDESEGKKLIELSKMLNEHFPLKGPKTNQKALEARVLFNLYFDDYKGDELNRIFNNWFVDYYNLEMENQKSAALFRGEFLRFISKNLNPEEEFSNLMQVTVGNVRKSNQEVREKNKQLIKSLNASFGELIEGLAAVAKNIRNTK